jgi:hypothetical protein
MPVLRRNARAIGVTLQLSGFSTDRLCSRPVRRDCS